MEQEEVRYEVRIYGKVIARGRVRTLLVLLFVFFSPLGFVLWPEGASTRAKWAHRTMLAAAYGMTYLLCQFFFNRNK